MITIRVKNKEYEFKKPYYLMPKDEFKLIKAVVKGSILVWNIKGEQITYNQIKKTLK
jgi:hypothetical protein